MCDRMPIELVTQILGATAELVFHTDVVVALNIARSSLIGYLSATPVIYRMVKINSGNVDAVGRIFSGEHHGTGSLSRSPAQRLCPLVKALFIDDALGIDSRRFSHLVNLIALYCFDYGIGLNLLGCSLPPRLTQYYALIYDPTYVPLATVTHVSIYFAFDAEEVSDFLHDCCNTLLPHTVTHVAIELNETIDASREDGIKEIVSFMLSRNSTAPVVLRLYRCASESFSLKVVMRVINSLATREDRRRVHIWRDTRPVKNGIDDLALSRRDAFDGRTPWTEASAVTE